MPRIQNFTMFPNFRYYSADNKGADFGVVIVKATFELMPSGRLVVADEQAPMLFDDECHGKPNESSLWHPSDLVPHKPNTDLIVNATARAPGNKPTSSWRCGIGIDGQGSPAEAPARDGTAAVDSPVAARSHRRGKARMA
jgi:hypothetical protein